MPTTFDTLEMGACNVTFKTTDLGLTKGGVEVEFGTEVATITADQHGDTVINDVIKGRSIKVKVPMAERDLTKLAAVFPGSSLVGAASKKLVINAATGTSLRALAGELVLHPKDRATNDKAADVTIPLAMSKGDIQFSFKHDDQRVYTVEFTGYVNLETGVLFVLGDPAAAAA
jgi:hypothetical protein